MVATIRANSAVTSSWVRSARGFGIHAYAHQVKRPIRLTDQELRAHPEWRDFGAEKASHPPMRGP